MNVEMHAFGNFVPSNSETLIIGTFPTHSRNWDFNFFYPNPSNSFWKIINSIFSKSPFQFLKGEDAVNERKKIAVVNKFALTDMLLKAIRKEGNSGDEQLIEVELMNIFSILSNCPTLYRIILTSRSGSINALSLFEKHLAKNETQLHKARLQNIITGVFYFENRQIKIFVPYSPSPRVIRRYGFDYVRDMYYTCFAE